MLKGKRLGFIGGGQMCEAIFSGVISSNELLAEDIFVTDVNTDRLSFLKEKYKINTIINTLENEGSVKIIENCDIIIIAVKPQLARNALNGLDGYFTRDKLVISIMGGITLDFLKEFITAAPTLRVMPNTPMLVQKGAAGIAKGENATNEHCALAEELFNLIGISYVLDEKLIDPLTGVSGCSPAFIYMFIEALADAGVKNGLPREMAVRLAAQAVAGSAEMVLKTGEHPGQLKDKVCSPGGSTIAGVHSLEKDAFRGAVINAVDESCKKMTEVGKKA